MVLGGQKSNPPTVQIPVGGMAECHEFSISQSIEEMVSEMFWH